MDLGDLIKKGVWCVLEDIYTTLPGEVVSYDSESRMANVRVSVDKYFIGQGRVAHPEVKQVPVVWPSTPRSGIVASLQRGDPVMLHFSSRALDNWISGSSRPSKSRRKFSLTDAFAVPGLFNFSHSPEQGDMDGMTVYHNNSKVVLKDNEVTVSNNQAEIILSDQSVQIKNAANELLDLIDQLIDALIVTTVPVGGAAVPLSTALTTLPEIKIKLATLKG